MTACIASTQAPRGQQPRTRAQRGERFNDTRLYERFKLEARKAYHHAYGRITDDQWDAAFNMSYWKFCQAEASSPGVIEHPASWLATIAKNEIVSEHRKTSRQAPLFDSGEPSSCAPDLASAIEQRRLLRDVCFVLNLLPARQKRVWSARFMGDYSPEEIMRVMGLSRKAYEKALQQATSFLIEKLEQARRGVCGTVEMESLVRGYAIWGDEHYSSERSALARAHLADCAACRTTARLIRVRASDARPSHSPQAPSLVEASGSQLKQPAAGRTTPRPARPKLARRRGAPLRRQRVLAG